MRATCRIETLVNNDVDVVITKVGGASANFASKKFPPAAASNWIAPPCARGGRRTRPRRASSGADSA
jgi:hypothetical protein